MFRFEEETARLYDVTATLSDRKAQHGTPNTLNLCPARR